MHRRKNKNFTVNHFVTEGFLGYIIFFGLWQGLESWKRSTVGKRIKFCLKQIDLKSVKASVSSVVRELRRAGNEDHCQLRISPLYLPYMYLCLIKIWPNSILYFLRYQSYFLIVFLYCNPLYVIMYSKHFRFKSKLSIFT
jgi:hypothetical protein